MDFDAIFKAYYAQYRTEATTPNSDDDEYTIALELANEAIDRWKGYDNTYWRELFTTLVDADDGDKVIVADTVDYECPGDMEEIGGYVRILDADNNTLRRYQIIEPHERQFKSDSASFAYFTGDVNNGFTMHLNPVPDTAIVGMTIQYDYYKTPTLMTTGTDKPEMARPYFMVHRMLASRFRGSRNPFRNDAKNDAEDVLKTMQLTNNSGTWTNPWSLPDNSGSVWGQ